MGVSGSGAEPGQSLRSVAEIGSSSRILFRFRFGAGCAGYPGCATRTVVIPLPRVAQPTLGNMASPFTPSPNPKPRKLHRRQGSVGGYADGDAKSHVADLQFVAV